MFKIIYDDVGEYDLLHPCCSIEMYDFFYKNGKVHPNCLDNINNSLKEIRPIIHPVNLFMHTKINNDGSITVNPPLSKAGSKIILEVKMNMSLEIAACNVSESDCNNKKCTPIKVIVQS